MSEYIPHILALVAVIGVGITFIGGWIKIKLDYAKLSNELSHITKWQDTHEAESHKRLESIDNKLTSLARDLNQLIGAVKGVNFKDKS